MLVLFLLLLPCLGVVSWNEIVEKTDDTALGTVSAIGQAMAQFVILMMAVALFLVEGFPMFVEHYFKRRLEEGRVQGREEGLRAGREERDREWREFLMELRSELQRKGIDVELPPPPPTSSD